MANARQAQLQAQRGFTYGSSSKIKILAPVNTSLSTIQKQTAKSELSSMVDKYNAGEVGNDQMLTFLNTQLTNPTFTPQEKVDIQDQIRNFSTLVQKDSLEASFNSAPENSLAKIQAAQALSKFYSDRAGSLVSGTPAQSTALSNKASWDSQIQTITGNMNKMQRSNLEQTSLQKINQLPTSSSQRSTATAQMYQQLYDMAISQGDTADANVYASKYQQANTMAEQFQVQEVAQAGKAQRGNVINILNQAKNDYNDGKIDAQGYYDILNQVNDYAVTNNDATLQNSVNSEADRVAKIEAKGGLNIGTAGGLPVVLKGGGGSGTVTNWDQQAFNYSDNIRLAQAMLHAGKDASGNPYTSDMYAQDISRSVTEYATALQSETATMETLAQTNPNQKVYFEGKKQRVADVVDQLYKNQDAIAGQVDALNNGTATLMEIPPKESATNPNGKAVTTYAFVDKNNIDPNTTVSDSSGILHAIKKETAPFISLIMSDPLLQKQFIYQDGTQKGQLNQSLISQSVGSGGFYDSNNVWHKISPDSAGNPIAETNNQYANVYKPGTTEKTSYPYWQGKTTPIDIPYEQTHVEGSQARAQMDKAKAIQAQQTMLPKVTPTPVQVTPPGKNVLTPQPIKPAQVAAIAPTKPVSITPTMPGLTSASIPQSQPVQGLPGLMSVNPPKMPISIAAPTPVNIPQALSSGGLKTMYTPAPMPPKVTAPSIGTILTGAAGQAINKLKSLFHF